MYRLPFGRAILAAAVPAVALAQAAEDGTGRMDLLGVVQRLDPAAMALIGVGVLIILVIVWRIVAMIRRERPAPRPPVRRAPKAPTRGGDSLSRPTIQAPTDWGHDQNKRAADVRVDVSPLVANTRIPPAIDTSTQWPLQARRNADASVNPIDALGGSPLVQPSPYRTGVNPYYLRSEPVEQAVEVEEVADVLTQAELLVQLGDPKEAMNVLSRHIRETEQPGPQVWLMLLDLYHATGRESQYKALAEGFEALFNAAVPPWPAGASEAERTLKDYPQVLKRTMADWPKPECRAYLEKLLNDDRGGSRQGFSLTAYRDILFLVDILHTRDLLDREDAEQASIERKLNDY